jgi:hypothetical protein
MVKKERKGTMIKNDGKVKAGVIAFVCIMIVATFSQVFSWGHWGGRHCGSYWGPRYSGLYFGWGYGGYPTYFDDSYYYHRNYVVIDKYDTVVIKKNPVAPAAQSAATQTNPGPGSKGGPVLNPSLSDGDTVTITIPNSSGNYTPVRLIKRGEGFSGPQGESYPLHPTVAQLQVLYGK